MCCQCLLHAAFNIIDTFEGSQLHWPVCHKHLLIQWMDSAKHKVTIVWKPICANNRGAYIKQHT